MNDEDEETPEFTETEGANVAAFMTIVLLFGEAARGANRDEKKALYDARLMLKDRKPLSEIAQAILDARGPNWSPGPEVMATIESLNAPKE